MSQQNFLFIYRLPPAPAPQTPPSPAEMQAMMARWQGWKAKFATNVVDLGDGLKPGGRKLASGVVTDGAFIEAKEVVGGYWILDLRSPEEAVEWARRVPGKGCTVEVRRVFEIEDFPPEIQEAAAKA